MRTLVTGGAGFIGSNLVDALVKEGHSVSIIDNLSTGVKKNLNPKAQFYKLDIRNLKKIKPIFKNIEVVFHLAAQPRIQPSIINPVESHDNNVVGTLNVLVASRDAGVEKFIYSASSSVYGDQKESPLRENMIPHPKNPYALFKLIGEKYCELFNNLYGLPTVCLRYFNVYGPRQVCEGAYSTVIGIFLRQAKAKEPLTIVGDGKQTRDFTNVNDVVKANVLAMNSSKVGKGEIINIGTGKKYSINQIASLISNNVVYIPPLPGEVRDTLAGIGLANEILGWEPNISMEEYLKKEVAELGIK